MNEAVDQLPDLTITVRIETSLEEEEIEDAANDEVLRAAVVRLSSVGSD